MDKMLESASYFCTWCSQGRVGENACRDGMHEKHVFGKGGFAEFFAGIREDLLFVFDDGWDVPVGVNPQKEGEKFGAMFPHPTRFPSIKATDPAERLKELVALTESYGWKGVGLWVCIHSQAEQGAPEWKGWTAEEEWREKMRWCHEAGVKYLKVDWGSNCGDVEFRRMLSRVKNEIAPEIVVEHAIPQPPVNGFNAETKSGSGRRLRSPEEKWLLDLEGQMMPFSDRWRIYDWYDPLVVPQCLDRTLQDLKIAEESGSKAIISTEDCCYLGAVLGCDFGIMRGETPRRAGDEYSYSNCRRLTEVYRAVAWSRIAPSFPSTKGFEVRWGNKVNTDTYHCSKENFWYEPLWGIDLDQSAPASSSRGMSLPMLKSSACGETDFVTCCRNPNGAVAVLAMPRTTAKGWKSIPTEVELDFEPREGGLLGVFGEMKSLTVKCDPMVRITARDLAGGDECDITGSCGFGKGRVTIDGVVLGKIGTSRNADGDKSLPGALLRFRMVSD